MFSGILVPITFFPEALEKITQCSPFPVLVFGPVNSLQSGGWTWDFGQQLLIGGVWILLLLLHLFYVTITRINLIGFIRDARPSILTFIVVINWSQLDFSIFSIFGGIVIFIFGQILFQCVMFALALPVFWSGESSALFKLIYGLWEFIQAPFKGVPVIIKAIFTWLIPLLFVTVISSSVFLTKSDPLPWSIVTIVLACIFLMVKSFREKRCSSTPPHRLENHRHIFFVL